MYVIIAESIVLISPERAETQVLSLTTLPELSKIWEDEIFRRKASLKPELQRERQRAKILVPGEEGRVLRMAGPGRFPSGFRLNSELRANSGRIPSKFQANSEQTSQTLYFLVVLCNDSAQIPLIFLANFQATENSPINLARHLSSGRHFGRLFPPQSVRCLCQEMLHFPREALGIEALRWQRVPRESRRQRLTKLVCEFRRWESDQKEQSGLESPNPRTFPFELPPPSTIPSKIANAAWCNEVRKKRHPPKGHREFMKIQATKNQVRIGPTPQHLAPTLLEIKGNKGKTKRTDNKTNTPEMFTLFLRQECASYRGLRCHPSAAPGTQWHTRSHQLQSPLRMKLVGREVQNCELKKFSDFQDKYCFSIGHIERFPALPHRHSGIRSVPR